MIHEFWLNENRFLARTGSETKGSTQLATATLPALIFRRSCKCFPQMKLLAVFLIMWTSSSWNACSNVNQSVNWQSPGSQAAIHVRAFLLIMLWSTSRKRHSNKSSGHFPSAEKCYAKFPVVEVIPHLVSNCRWTGVLDIWIHDLPKSP